MSRDGEVELSKPDKVLFPDDGVTKQDLADYYADVAEVMLPHLRGRPIAMQRFPDGVGASGFFEKKLPQHFPDWFDRVEVETAEEPQEQPVVADRRSLVFLADQACVTPHVWLSRRERLQCPDQLIVDLDPAADDVGAVRAAVRVTADLFDELGLVPWVKTTGSRGYHVQCPLDGSSDFDDVRSFARGVADLLAQRHPDELTVEQRKRNRGDRIYVDVMRNAYGQTAVPPYAVRARAGAPVATPIEWSELTRVTPDRYTISSVRRRLAQRSDPWAGMQDHAQSLETPRRRLEELMASV